MLAIGESDTTVLVRQNGQEKKKAVMEMDNLNTICLI